MTPTQYLLIVNHHTLATFNTRLQAVAEAWRLGLTSYDVQSISN